MIHRVKGIILRKQDYRENDRFFVIYTDELGKIEAVAKGVKKIKSKMAGHLDFFSVVNLMVAPGRVYYQIAGADILKNFSDLKSDLGKIILGSCVLEMVDNFVKPEHSDLKIYKLVEDCLTIFNNRKNKDFLKLYGFSKFFIIKLFVFLGWTPELYVCVRCKKKIIPNGNYFDAERGGLVCGQCAKFNLPISTPAIKILRFVSEKDLKKSVALKITKAHVKELAKIIDAFVAVHQDKEIKSAMWINHLTQTLLI